MIRSADWPDVRSVSDGPLCLDSRLFRGKEQAIMEEGAWYTRLLFEFDQHLSLSVLFFYHQMGQGPGLR